MKQGVPQHNCAFCNKTVPIEEKALLYEDVKATSTVKLPNKYAVHDPTVPVYNNIPCQKKSCPSHADADRRAVAAVLIDEVNLRYYYACRVCDETWTN